MLPTKLAAWSLIANPSAARHPLRLDKDRIDRLARRHEQPVALLAAESNIRAALRQHDAADHLTVGRIDGDAVLRLAAAPGTPQIAVDIDANAVAAARLGGAELAPVGRLRAVL